MSLLENRLKRIVLCEIWCTCSANLTVSGRVPEFGMNSEGNNEPDDLCPLCKRKSPQSMQDARQQASGHVMSAETKPLLVASFIGGLLDDDKMAATVSDPVVKFQSCTQLSNGQNKQHKRSNNTGL